LLLAKFGAPAATTASIRRILFRHMPRTAYDIHLIHWSVNWADSSNINEATSSALSQRFEDQVNDAGIVDFDAMLTENGIFGVFEVNSDNLTSGGGPFVGNHEIVFPRPYRIPYASFISTPAVAGAIRIGVEVYFERVTITPFEQAELVARAGGRTQTS